MGTLDTPPRLRSALGGLSAKPLLPRMTVQGRASPVKACAPHHRVIAQAPRPQTRVLEAEGPQFAPIPQAVVHYAVSLMRIVLKATYEGGAHLTYNNGAFQRFDCTHWIPLSDAELGGAILANLPSGANRGSRHARTMIREVTDLLKMHRATGLDRRHLADPQPIINVANGELWIKADGTVERRPHNPASGLRYCLDVIYDPTAECSLYDHTLTEIFSASDDPAALVALWHELVGYAAQPARPDARIFVGWGAGNDGKSALAGLLTRLLGRDRVAAMPVGKLASSPFMLGHLADKALFLDDDVAVGTVLPDGLLKTISEDKVVTGEPKHRDAFEFRVRVLPLLLCNTAPHLHDTSPGFLRRVIVLRFDRRFTDAEADRTLFARIWAGERSGVLNRALAGLRRVVQRGWKFDPPEAVTRATEAWWTEATGASSEVAEPARRPAQSSMRSRVPPTPRTRATPVGAREVTPIGSEAGTDVRVSIELPATGKARAVHVRVGQASVEVHIASAPALFNRAPNQR